MTGKLMLAAGMLVLFTSVQAAPSSETTFSAQEDAVARKKAEKEELAKIQELEEQCAKLRTQIEKKRAQLLKTNPKLIKMYLELVRQARELALELDSNREIQELNEAFLDAGKKLHQIKRDRQQRKKELEAKKNGLLK